jgi:hypothetical protein
MRKLLIVMVTIGALVGCATQNSSQYKNTVWVPLNPVGTDFKKDNYDCVQQSRTSWSGGGTGGLGLFMMLQARRSAEGQAEDLFNMCMEAKGYILRNKEEVAEYKRIAEEKNSDPNRGFTGITFGYVPEQKPIIVKVFPNSPAAKAGLKANDIIIERDGHAIPNVGELRNMKPVKVGDWVEYKVLRGTEELVFKVQTIKKEQLQ